MKYKICAIRTNVVNTVYVVIFPQRVGTNPHPCGYPIIFQKCKAEKSKSYSNIR